MARSRVRLALLLLSVFGTGIIACAPVVSTGSLPDGGGLLRSAATQMSSVQSAHFTLSTNGTVAGTSVRTANGVITRDGDVQGSGQLEELGQRMDIEFVFVGNTAYVKGPTGGFQRLAVSVAASVYDPSAILDPTRGVVHLLMTARNPHTETREKVGGQQAYRVRAQFDQQALSTLLPGVTGTITGQLWIGASPHRLLQVRFAIPAASGGQSSTITVTLSGFDQPTNIRPPS